METNLKGTVKWEDFRNKGYGFIKDKDSDADYFMHLNDTLDKDVRQGDSVIFDLKEGRKGIIAVNVKRLRYV